MTRDPGQVARLEGWAATLDAALVRCPHLTSADLFMTGTWFPDLDVGTVVGPASGLIVGEMPGPRTSPRLPMFPYPPGSAGGRLWSMSRLPLGPYLGRLMRTNLVREWCPNWPYHAARRSADELVARLAGSGARVVLCGARVLTAFSSTVPHRSFERFELLGATYVGVPHPSGRSRAHNDPDVRRQTRRAVQWAAHWQEVERG